MPACAWRYGGYVDAREGYVRVSVPSVVPVAHHAPEGRTAPYFKHARRRFVGEHGRAYGPAEKLEEEEGAEALAV